MIRARHSSYFFVILLSLGLIISFFILQPFLITLALASMAAIVFHPLYRYILDATGGQPSVASLVTIFFIILCLLIPLVALGVQLFQEARGLYLSLTDPNQQLVLLDAVRNFKQTFQNFFPPQHQFSVNFNEYFRQGLELFIQNLGGILSSFSSIVIHCFIFIISLYYFLKDGEAIKKKLIFLSPLEPRHNDQILEKLGVGIHSIIRGNLAIALIQGVLTSIGFALFGIPNIALWGALAAIAALIPGIGTGLIMTPAILFLFFTSQFYFAFGLLLWGVLAVGLIDNFLGPKLVSRGIQIHPLVVFLSVLGGIAFFGVFGFLLGPLTVSMIFTLLDIYVSDRKKVA